MKIDVNIHQTLVRAIALYLTFAVSTPAIVFASPESEAAVRALAEVNKVSALIFEEVNLEKSEQGFTFQYHRVLKYVNEECTGKYRADGRLDTLSCRYENVTPSLEEKNQRTIITAVRTYAGRNKMVKVKGHMNVSRLIKGKRLKDRPITSPSDPLIMKLSRPLLALPPEAMTTGI